MTNKAKKIRVVFHGPSQSASVWVEQVSAEPLRIRLLRAYPGLQPALGWSVEHRGQCYLITGSVDGLIHCGPKDSQE